MTTTGNWFPLRFAEAVCAGHPDRLSDSIADGIVALATGRDPEALVGVEVALHRKVVFVDGRIAAGPGPECAVTEEEVAGVVREAYALAGYGDSFDGPEKYRLLLRARATPRRGALRPLPRAARGGGEGLPVRGRRPGDRRGLRLPGRTRGADPPRAGARARLREGDRGAAGERRKRWIGPTARSSSRCAAGGSRRSRSRSTTSSTPTGWRSARSRRRRASASRPSTSRRASWNRRANPSTGSSTARAPSRWAGRWASNGLSGKKLVAEAYGTAVPIGGGTVHGKDPLEPDVRAQRIAREWAVSASGRARRGDGVGRLPPWGRGAALGGGGGVAGAAGDRVSGESEDRCSGSWSVTISRSVTRIDGLPHQHLS